MKGKDDLLTPRERQIISLRERGITVKEIAWQLGISHHTVKTQLSHIQAKTHAVCTLAAIYQLRLQGFMPTAEKSAEAQRNLLDPRPGLGV